MAASNLTIRLATAGVMVPLLLLLLFAGPAWGWLLFLMVIGVTGGWEIFSMTHPGDNVARVAGILLTWAVTLAIWFGFERPAVMLTTFVLLPFVSVVLALWRLRDVNGAALQLMTGTFGPM